MERWLTLDALCTTLRLNRKNVLALANAGYLAVMWGLGDRKHADARFLNPSEEYAKRLLLAEALHKKAVFVPEDLDEKALFTLRELAEICGWTKKSAENYIHRNKIKGVPVRLGEGGVIPLYTSKLIRSILWNRRDRKAQNKQVAPYLLKDLVKWFQEHYSAEEALIPTDIEHMFDAKMRKRLEITIGIGAQKDFADKVELARKIVQILESVKS